MTRFTCCLCGKSIDNEYGNNPAPINNEKGARCCDACNETKVIPARIRIMLSSPSKSRKGVNE